MALGERGNPFVMSWDSCLVAVLGAFVVGWEFRNRLEKKNAAESEKPQTAEERVAAISAFKFCPVCSCAWEQHIPRYYTGVVACARCGCQEMPPAKPE